MKIVSTSTYSGWAAMPNGSLKRVTRSFSAHGVARTWRPQKLIITTITRKHGVHAIPSSLQ